MYEDTDPQVQTEMAALILLIQRGDSADIERQEQTLRQTMEDRNRTDADIVGVPSLGGFRGKFAEGAEPALCEYAIRRFEGHEQDAANVAAFKNGTVGVREERVFDESVAVEAERLIHGPGCLPCGKHAV